MRVEKEASSELDPEWVKPFEIQVEALLRVADNHGMVLTIERISDLPPAMGHGHYRMNLWKKRGAA